MCDSCGADFVLQGLHAPAGQLTAAPSWNRGQTALNEIERTYSYVAPILKCKLTRALNEHVQQVLTQLGGGGGSAASQQQAVRPPSSTKTDKKPFPKTAAGGPGRTPVLGNRGRPAAPDGCKENKPPSLHKTSGGFLKKSSGPPPLLRKPLAHLSGNKLTQPFKVHSEVADDQFGVA